MAEPRMPSTIVMRIEMFWCPGMTSRARPPMMAPTTTAMRMVWIMGELLTWRGLRSEA